MFLILSASHLPLNPVFNCRSRDSIPSHKKEWEKYYSSKEPHKMAMPEPWGSKLDSFQKMMVQRCLRPDKVCADFRETATFSLFIMVGLRSYPVGLFSFSFCVLALGRFRSFPVVSGITRHPLLLSLFVVVFLVRFFRGVGGGCLVGAQEGQL